MAPISPRQFRFSRTQDESTVGKQRTGQRTYTLTDERGRDHATMAALDYSNDPVERLGWNEQRYGRGPNQYSDGEGRPGQQVLFKEFYGDATPGQSKLINAAMTKDARAMALPMLAQVARDTAEMGRTLVPSENLSPHSAPLVRKLQERGLVDPSAPARVTNGIGFMGGPWEHTGQPHEEELDLGLAKKYGRSLLRQSRRRPDPGEQQRLPIQ